MRKVVIIINLFVIMALLAGCGSSGKAVDQQSVAGLPDGYPQDLFPVVDDSVIKQADKTVNKYSVVLLSKKSLPDVMNFYKGVVKNADNLSQTPINKGGTFSGKKSQYNFIIIVAPASSGEEAQTSVAITLTTRISK